MARASATFPGSPFRGVTPKPVTFLKIATGLASPTHVYLTDSNLPTESWNGQTWTRRPIDVPGASIQGQSEPFAGQIRVGDADGYFAGLIDTSGATFDLARIVVYVTDRTIVEAGTTERIAQVFSVTSYVRGEGYIAFNVKDRLGLAAALETPGPVFNETDYPGLPR